MSATPVCNPAFGCIQRKGVILLTSQPDAERKQNADGRAKRGWLAHLRSRRVLMAVIKVALAIVKLIKAIAELVQ